MSKKRYEKIDIISMLMYFEEIVDANEIDEKFKIESKGFS